MAQVHICNQSAVSINVACVILASKRRDPSSSSSSYTRTLAAQAAVAPIMVDSNAASAAIEAEERADVQVAPAAAGSAAFDSSAVFPHDKSSDGALAAVGESKQRHEHGPVSGSSGSIRQGQTTARKDVVARLAKV
jgi:hypothetical protein